MMTMPAIMADELGKHIASDFRRLFGSAHQDKAERLDGAARMALECLGKSDALYHNVEHTFLVTLVGRDILHDRMLTERLEPDDYSHLIVACLLHDIGLYPLHPDILLMRSLGTCWVDTVCMRPIIGSAISDPACDGRNMAGSVKGN